MNELEQCSPPILSCAEAKELESELFAGQEPREWKAMQTAGRAIANAVLDDFRELGGFPADGRVLVLVGKGHNGGDALIAAREILMCFPAAKAEVILVFGERSLRPLAARAWRELVHGARDRATRRSVAAYARTSKTDAYTLCLDGIFGFQFRPPVAPRVAALIDQVNEAPIRLRAAVDLPSGDLFRADFTYATGSVKAPLLASGMAGRRRYLDLGFFPSDGTAPGTVTDRVLTPAVLEPLRGLRAPQSDKRHYGHVFLLGGSRSFPGAIFMAVAAALKSGAGLVTAFVPESFASSFAAAMPEAIWVGWPETPEGSLALEGEHRLDERIERADALVIGPGIGREPETLALMASIAGKSKVPLVIDADALQRDVVKAGTAPRVLTPHAGEFARVAEGGELRAFATASGVVVTLKGPVTRVCGGGVVYHSFFGGPVLARGGSGDLLAGMTGTQLAQVRNPLLAAARAAVWHGLAADRLARSAGQVAVRTTQLLDFLGPALDQGPGRI